LNSVVNGSIVGDTTDFMSLGWILTERSRDMHRRSSQSSNEKTGIIGLLDFLTKPLEHFLPSLTGLWSRVLN
jgi:hypothetical protein